MEVDNKDEEDDNEDESDEVDCPMEECKSKTSISWVGKKLTQIVRDLRLNVPCENRDAGCTYKCADDEMEEHEDECEDRKVECDFAGCKDVPFKDLLHHLRDVHKVDYDTKKWKLINKIKPTRKDESIHYKGAYMFETGPDGLVFITDIMQDKNSILEEGHFRIAVRVIGGYQVAKKYRVELRVSSNKSSVSLTHSGPVFPIEYTDVEATKDEESFEISCSKFAFFNHRKEYFGKHNKDKSGYIVLPVSVKIEKKKLGVSTD